MDEMKHFENQEEWIKYMVETFPKLYPTTEKVDDNIYTPFELFEFETPQGWNKLLFDLSWLITDYCENNNVDFPDIQQVKSKFGELRYYYSGGDKYISILISGFEEQSTRTCENCGSHDDVKTGGKGWVVTLCKNCRGE
jgi:hypothetical protein